MSTFFTHKVELSNVALQLYAPSLFATAPIDGVSPKYSFLPTIKIVDALRDAGWAPVGVSEKRTRLGTRRGFQKHLVSFQRREIVAVRDEYAPEIALVNSHDASSAFQLHTGLFRFLCANGLIVSDGTFAATSIRHSGHELEEVVNASLATHARSCELAGRVEEFRARRLTEAESIEFAKQAIELRWDDVNTAPVGPARLLRPLRREDSGDDLWSTFNRVQEGILRGGQRDWSRTKADGKTFAKTKTVSGLDESIRLNKALWGLAEAFRVNAVVTA